MTRIASAASMRRAAGRSRSPQARPAPGTRSAAAAPDARVAERREVAPDRLVERQVRPEGEQRGTTTPSPSRIASRGERCVTSTTIPRSPAGARSSRAGELLERARLRETKPLQSAENAATSRERSAALGDGAVDDGTLDDEPGHDGEARAGERPDDGGPLAGAQQRVGQDERDRAERQVQLPGQRHGDERPCAEREPARITVAPALEAEQRQRDQERHQPEQVAGRLHDPVRGEREGEPAGERRRRAGGRASAATSRSRRRRARTRAGRRRSRRRRLRRGAPRASRAARRASPGG